MVNFSLVRQWCDVRAGARDVRFSENSTDCRVLRRGPPIRSSILCLCSLLVTHQYTSRRAASDMAMKVPLGVSSQSGGSQPGQKPRIILAASGSVAAIKFAVLADSLSDWAEVRAVATKPALHFIDRQSLSPTVKLYVDEDEWASWGKIGDDVLHIELRKWADAMVIAPLSANTLAKVAGGLCDNLLTCIIRAWDYSKPVFVAPAMNTFMWENPFTQRHLESVRDLGFLIISPIPKKLACGDYGNGAMAEPSVIDSTLRLSMHNRESQVKPMVLDSL